jgi:hypothetical protein
MTWKWSWSRVTCLLQGCFHFRSFFTLCTGSHYWPPGALQTMGLAGSHLFHWFLQFAFQGEEVSKPVSISQTGLRVGKQAEFWTGRRELRNSITLPASLSVFRPFPTVNHPMEGRRLGKSWGPRDLTQALSPTPLQLPHSYLLTK